MGELAQICVVESLFEVAQPAKLVTVTLFSLRKIVKHKYKICTYHFILEQIAPTHLTNQFHKTIHDAILHQHNTNKLYKTYDAR
jgi:hypothetical protein